MTGAMSAMTPTAVWKALKENIFLLFAPGKLRVVFKYCPAMIPDA
jgi:hypothetical protein